MSHEVGRAAKALISVEDNRYVFVAGRRGRLNLPGGGIAMVGVRPETLKEALDRELYEELGMRVTELSGLTHIGCVEGWVTPADAARKLAHWTVFRGVYERTVEDLVIPAGSEITGIEVLTAAEFQAHPAAYDLARMAVGLEAGGITT